MYEHQLVIIETVLMQPEVNAVNNLLGDWKPGAIFGKRYIRAGKQLPVSIKDVVLPAIAISRVVCIGEMVMIADLLFSPGQATEYSAAVIGLQIVNPVKMLRTQPGSSFDACA